MGSGNPVNPRGRTGRRNDGRISPLGGQRLLFPPALDGRGEGHGFPVFRHGAAGDVDAFLLQDIDQGIVGEHVVGRLLVDELPDAVSHRFRGMSIAPVGGGDRGGEE